MRLVGVIRGSETGPSLGGEIAGGGKLMAVVWTKRRRRGEEGTWGPHKEGYAEQKGRRGFIGSIRKPEHSKKGRTRPSRMKKEFYDRS